MVLVEGPGFELSRVPIPRALAPFVESWLGYREVSAQSVERVELPSGRAVLIFEFGAPIEICQDSRAPVRFGTGFFAGIDDRPTLTRFVSEQAGIEVNLSPAGAFALGQGGLSELRGLAVESHALGIDADLGPKLYDARSWEARFELVAAALSARIQGARPLSGLVRRALARIDAEPGSVRINDLSEALGVSRTHIHERFVAETGFTPKRYAALRRFAHAKELLRRNTQASIANVAVRSGYADHAHFSREVREFAGMTPTALARQARDPLAIEVERLLDRRA